jgi:hypothetical protein
MGYRTTAVVAVITTMTLAGGPAVAETWLPSWLDNVVNGSSSASASSTDLSSKGVRAPLAQNTNRRVSRHRHANRTARHRSRATIVANQAGAERAASASCLTSAAAVRQVQPKAWPKWTYGPQGERCWYAGAKPVFAKRHHQRPSPTRMAAKRASPPAFEPVARAAPQPAPVPAPASDGRSHRESAPQPWALEYRWNGGVN